MENEIFLSMRGQLCPSEEVQTALRKRLGEETHKKETPMKRYLAAAACAALLLCAYPVYNALKPQPRLHAYTVIQRAQLESYTATKQESGIEETGDIGGGAYISEPNTGDLPGQSGDDIPAQPGADAYQLLMSHFGETLPDWYGGAYVTKNGTLMVLLVNDKDPGDKTLELEVLEAAGGRTAPVGFAGVKYSRNDLLRLNGELLDLLDGRGLPATWGIYDDQNRIVLDFSETPPQELLAELNKLDPDGDAIFIRVVESSAIMTDVQKGPDPIGSVALPYGGTVDEEEGEEPGLHFADPNAPAAPDDEDLIAYEPQIEDLPQRKGVVEGSAIVTDVQKSPDPIGSVALPYGGTVDEEEGEEPGLYFADPNAPATPDDEDLIAYEPQIEDLPQHKGPERVERLPEYDLLPIEE